MSNNVPIITKVSEYVQSTYPLFGEFLKVYYKYAQKQENAIGAIQNTSKKVDIDFTDDLTLDNFYKTYADQLPKNIAYDKRNLIKLLNAIYEAKGTEDSLKLLFRLIFNESAEVSYPNTQILRASDGKWSQDTFITLVIVSGVLPATNDTLRVEDGNTYDVKITRVEVIDNATTRFYFKTYNKITFTENQLIYAINETDSIIYAGKLIKSPAKLLIKIPGQSWQKGQIVIIPGTAKDTIARVTGIDSVGGITTTEIIDYGFEHLSNQVLTVSPYPNKPVGSVIDINSVDVGDHTNYTIDILDYTEGVEESINGFSTGFSQEAFFLENYLSGDYVLNSVFHSESKSIPVVASNVDSSLTMEKWLNSRASFVYDTATSVKTRGFFKDDSGQLSNEVARMQDNYFYQPFSYVIETKKDIKDYERLSNLYHPAGTKGFSSLAKIATCEFSYQASRTLSIDTLYLRDFTTAYDSYYNVSTKVLNTTVTLSELRANVLNKPITGDSVTVNHANSYIVGETGQAYTSNYFSEGYVTTVKLLTIG